MAPNGRGVRRVGSRGAKRTQASARQPQRPQQRLRALALLESSATENVQLIDIERSVGLSPSPFHFLRVFKRELGVTRTAFSFRLAFAGPSGC